MENTDDFVHAYDEKNVNTCQTCKNIYAEIGDTDAQYEDYHPMVPIKKGGRKTRTRKSRKSKKSRKAKKSRKSRRLRRK